MNQVQIVSDEGSGSQVAIEVNRRLESLANVPDLEPEDLAAVVKHARDAGMPIEHDPRVRSLYQQFLLEFDQRKAQYSSNSWRQLQYGWRKFAHWCDSAGVPSLPARSRDVERYIVSLAENMHRNSLGTLLWAIRIIHVKAGCVDPTSSTLLRDRMKGVRREKVESGEVISQATPLRQADLDVIGQSWGLARSVYEQRNWLAINLAYETMLRESELARVKIEEIELIDDGSGLIIIPMTKTNKTGEIETISITEMTVALIDEYLTQNQLDWSSSGYLLRGLTKYDKLRARATTPLSNQSIDRIFKAAWEEVKDKRAGLRNRKPFSSHSCRVGAAQDLMSAGYTIPGIMQSGRWSSVTMVYRYCRKIMAQEGAMFKMRRDLQCND